MITQVTSLPQILSPQIFRSLKMLSEFHLDMVNNNKQFPKIPQMILQADLTLLTKVLKTQHL